jgi:sarcosine oxidase, subunit gamma
MLEHQQPFDSPPEARGSLVADGPGIRVQLAQLGLLLLQSPSVSALEDALTSEVGLGLPAAGQTRTRDEYTLLWLAPAEWLLDCPVSDAGSLHGALTRRLAASIAAVIDMSDAFASFEVSGTRACNMLMSGCSLNLHADGFPAGRVARTSLAGIPAIMRKTGEPCAFRCLVDRGYICHIRDWLLMIAR